MTISLLVCNLVHKLLNFFILIFWILTTLSSTNIKLHEILKSFIIRSYHTYIKCAMESIIHSLCVIYDGSGKPLVTDIHNNLNLHHLSLSRRMAYRARKKVFFSDNGFRIFFCLILYLSTAMGKIMIKICFVDKNRNIYLARLGEP